MLFICSMSSHFYELQQDQKALTTVILMTLFLHLEGFKHTNISLYRNLLIIEMKLSEKQQQCTHGNNLHIAEYLRVGNKAYQNLMLRQWQEENENWIKDELTPGSKQEENPPPFILLFYLNTKTLSLSPSILSAVKLQENLLGLEKRWMSSANLQGTESKGSQRAKYRSL